MIFLKAIVQRTIGGVLRTDGRVQSTGVTQANEMFDIVEIFYRT